MSEIWARLVELASREQTLTVLRAVLLVLGGLIVARLSAAAFIRMLGTRLDPHQTMVARRVIYFVLLGLFVGTALHQLGFRIGLLFGAAGVLSVALGFASQTSASNLVSGLFLLSEKPFAVGDVIRVGGPEGSMGEVLSIDALSVKLRTFDNLFVRIPNESLIKSEVTTYTRFPIRRIDLQVPVAYRADLELVRDTLLGVVDDNPRCLQEPEPLFILRGFAESALNLQFSVWVQTENFVEVRTELYRDVKRELEAHKIEIPFPQRTLHLHPGLLPSLQPDHGDDQPG